MFPNSKYIKLTILLIVCIFFVLSKTLISEGANDKKLFDIYNSSDIKIYGQGNVSTSHKTELIDMLEALPPKVLNVIKSNDYKIIITSYSISYEFIKDDSLKVMDGYFSSKNKTLYLSTTGNSIQNYLYFGIGELIDSYYQWPSAEGQFNDIYEKEKVKSSEYYDNIKIDNSMNYFASIFKLYLLKDGNLEFIAPYSFEYINRIISFL